MESTSLLRKLPRQQEMDQTEKKESESVLPNGSITDDFSLDGLEKIYIYAESQKDLEGEYHINRFAMTSPKKAIFLSQNAGKEDLEKLKTVWTAPHITKYVYDLKNWYHILASYDILPYGEIFDMVLASYVIDPSAPLSFEEIAFRETGAFLDPESASSLPQEQLSALKAGWMEETCKALQQKMEEKEVLSLYHDIEIPLSKVLFEMEHFGFNIDKAALNTLNESFKETIQRLEQEIYQEAGETFNINSPKQLGTLLFEKMGLPVIKKTKTGYSTDNAVLDELSKSYPIAEKIQEYRAVTKLEGTYGTGILKLINSKTHKIHTTFQQTVTNTGRLSSTEPNMQNIPVKTELGRDIRKVFIPSVPDNVILAADYSQIELRLLAHLSQDKNLMYAFQHDIDIHALTASEAFGVPLEEVTSAMRSKAKAVNFGIVYGISSFGLSNNLKIPTKEAQEYIDHYFRTYPGVQQYIDAVIKEAKKNGYVRTMLHRVRYIPDLNNKNFMKRSFAERAAVNTTIQGSAADLIKLAMIEIAEEMEKRKLNSKMVLQVHDELIFDVPQVELTEMTELVTQKMEHAFQLSIPLVVNVSSGKNWYEAK